MSISTLLHKIRRKLTKLRLQPIRVFCLHHVCEHFDATYMNDCDWMQLSVFQTKIHDLQHQGYKFISISEAYQRLKNDRFRINKYAVLTFDDGYKSLSEVLPWLEEKKIPVILFINSKYLDGMSCRKEVNEKYLTQNELFALNHPLIEIGSHGYEHTDASIMNKEEFLTHIEKNIEVLQTHPCYVPFHAYTWGRHTYITDKVLYTKGIIPVYADGMKNYNTHQMIHRELL